MSGRREAWARTFDELDFFAARLTVHGSRALAANTALANYLRAANIVLHELDDNAPLRLRLAQFPQLSFVRVAMPAIRMEWPRDSQSVDRAAIIVILGGRMSIRTDGVVLAREPGLYYVPPGTEPLWIDVLDTDNEVLYISLPAGLVADIPAAAQSDCVPPLDPSLIAPILAFTTGLFAVDPEQAAHTAPLRLIAEEVTRSLVRMISGDAPDSRDPYARAIELITVEYHSQALRTAEIARRLGVAPRTLQAEFTRRGETVSGIVRGVRVREARALRLANPALSMAEVAHATGFGSESALFRALRD
ncbi:AraC family transcriptional regulator [Mycetocola tolaasinivorans]|uniref:AraC family transcriptional regulator n=1 Tax=Mycetocola tolaasinivorans TaxID=76635 RepID=A0A3L7A9T3_9MICO|nr:helix-turn-helix domain-containing protein [Mycetocola tolaasinivorans]RLP77053.1 AraC family transcriptional regulator [Mycetocola tolaasinivorans]